MNTAINSSFNVLVVDDSEPNLFVFVKFLKLSGYQVDGATNGRAALALVDTTDYDLILMDCRMPILDGYATTQQLRQKERGRYHTPVIAMTANAMRGDREKCLAAGMDDYISKPMMLEDLALLIARWVRVGAINQQSYHKHSHSEPSEHYWNRNWAIA
jgi:two-component system CheB/CheR fusion protein